MQSLFFVPETEFKRIEESISDNNIRLTLISDMCRLNALSAVKRAGSGHLGSSFSSMDIFVYLYYSHLNTRTLPENDPNRDIFFSSKGHDVPGQYAVLNSVGLLSSEKLLNLRRLDGLCGHPDVATPFIEANTGSLGMGISKGKGIAIGKKLNGHSGKVIILTGDGEFQEGQNYEAMQNAVHNNVNNLLVILDHNKVQSDKPVQEILDLGDIENKFISFGWEVARCDGHNFTDLSSKISELEKNPDKPKILIADTIKGKGVSFMEHPYALKAGNGSYKWHSGAPDWESYQEAVNEIKTRIEQNSIEGGLKTPITISEIHPEQFPPSGVSDEYVADSFGDELIKIASENNKIVVLDADLALDCRIRGFEEKYPERFIECGIAEQDMVSTAGGLALQGFIPIVNSFGAFLTSRANEQIYNNACEKEKIIYVSHYAGLIPAGPGQSHQCLRDISLVNSVPDISIVQPCNDQETRMLLSYCVDEEINSSLIRLVIGPSPQKILLPDNYQLKKGCGSVIHAGKNITIISYGPVMLNEALTAAKILKEIGVFVEVINFPWLNNVDNEWIKNHLGNKNAIYIVEDHNSQGGLGSTFSFVLKSERVFSDISLKILGVEGLPAWGRPDEVLKHHNLDGYSIAQRILSDQV